MQNLDFPIQIQHYVVASVDKPSNDRAQGTIPTIDCVGIATNLVGKSFPRTRFAAFLFPTVHCAKNICALEFQRDVTIAAYRFVSVVRNFDSGLLFVARESRRFQAVCTASAHIGHKIKFNFPESRWSSAPPAPVRAFSRPKLAPATPRSRRGLLCFAPAEKAGAL
jgi:hypothetical protein